METTAMTKKTTWENLMQLMMLIKRVDLKKRSRLSFAVEKMATKWNKSVKKYQSLLSEIDIEFCSTDKDGNLMFEEVTMTDKDGNSNKQNTGLCKYTKDNRKKRDEKAEKFSQEMVEIPVHLLAKDEPSIVSFMKDLSFTEINLLTGTLIDMPEIDMDAEYDESWANTEAIQTNGQEKG